jgi:hypothetical protein
MNLSTENRTGFLGTYFDRDTVLRVAHLAGILAWMILAMSLSATFVSVGNIVWMTVYGGAYEGANLFDRLTILTSHFPQLSPGLAYFGVLKATQQVLLILLDLEDNSRRAARK